MFSDQRFDAAGMSLADPASSGMPGLVRGDFGIYSVFEQKLYRVGTDDDRGIGIFARASYSAPDRNLIDYYADTGLEFVGLAEGRPKDKFGIAAAYAHVSPRARALDLDFRSLLTPGWPARSFEGLITAVYQYELRAGWTLQPNLQFIVRPGGGATSPLSALPGRALKNAEVFGLRTVLKF
jgi:porin